MSETDPERLQRAWQLDEAADARRRMADLG